MAKTYVIQGVEGELGDMYHDPVSGEWDFRTSNKLVQRALRDVKQNQGVHQHQSTMRKDLIADRVVKVGFADERFILVLEDYLVWAGVVKLIEVD